MSTATAVLDEPLVSQPETKVLFMSRRSELRLTKMQRYPVMGPAGQKVGEQPGQVVAFREGVFRCPQEGVVVLEDGREADAADVHGWLERHQLHGDMEEGFWRVDPTAPPVSREELDRLMEAASNLDVETLQVILDQERAGWGREDIVRIAEGTIERIEAKIAEARADVEAHEKEERAAREKAEAAVVKAREEGLAQGRAEAAKTAEAPAPAAQGGGEGTGPQA